MLAVDGDGDDKGEIACIGLDSVADAFTIHWRSWARNDLGLVTICGWKLNKIIVVPDTEAMTAMRNIAYFILSLITLFQTIKNTLLPPSFKLVLALVNSIVKFIADILNTLLCVHFS